MKDEKELGELIKSKKFKTFWHCLDYLILANYKPLEAFSLTIKEFGEDRIYSDVAFINLVEPSLQYRDQVLNHINIFRERKKYLCIGIIDETNIHLSGMYSFYIKSLNDGSIKTNIIEIEETCDIIKVELTPFILHYLHEVSVKHFGYEVFKLGVNISDIFGETVQRETSHYVDALDAAIANTPENSLIYSNTLDGRTFHQSVNSPHRL